MSTGILTFHDGFNHGAFMQVYAMQKALNQIGIINKIINYKNMRHRCLEYRYAIPLRRPDRWLQAFSRIRSFRKAQKRLNTSGFHFSAKHSFKSHYDSVLFGSDEIWNLNNVLFGHDPTFFGKNVVADNLVSYAASFGSTSSTDNFPDDLSDCLSRFKAISVRDTNSYKIIYDLLGIDAIIVPDPVYLVDLKDEVINCTQKNFILIYIVKPSKEFISEAQNFSRKTGKKLISIGYSHKWCDENITVLDPFEWLGFIKAADYVITSMFHGTAFSIKFNKQFISEISPYRLNKFFPMLDSFGLNDRIYQPGRLDEIIMKDIDYSDVNIKIDEWVNQAYKFLKRNLL